MVDNDFEDVAGSAWAKFDKKGDVARGVFSEYFIKPERDQFPEQIVAVLVNATFNGEPVGTLNVGLSSKNARYANGIKSLHEGHQVIIELAGFWNQDAEQLVDLPGKTKKGMSFAKNYAIKQSKTVDPSYQKDKANEVFNDVGIDDTPF